MTFVVDGGLAAVLALLSWIDIRSGLLPDYLTLPLLAAGLLHAAIAVGGVPVDAVVGAVLAASMLALPALLYRRVRGRDGMGWGDVKLAGAAGAWVGWAGVPGLVLIAALLGILAALLRRWIAATPLSAALPFGPALCIATMAIWLTGAP